MIGACRLSPTNMPRQPARGGKRKRPPEERPSPQTLEVISFIRRGEEVVKKRTIEKRDFDPMAPSIVFPDDDVLPTPSSQTDPSPADDAAEESSSGYASRSVSVSLFFVCHVTTHPRSSQTKIQEWISHRPEFLYELLRLEAPSPHNMECSACKSPAEYRCLSCFPRGVMCKDCLLFHHSDTPLHSIQVCPLTFIADNYNLHTSEMEWPLLRRIHPHLPWPRHRARAQRW